MKKLIYPAALILLFIILTTTILPADAVYGSNTDWLSQHAALAETIRDACVEQHTLLPDWIDLGSGSSGYQFSYYGFLRPDILIGCLFPQVPMVYILIGYMLALYLASVLLCYMWLQSEDISPFFSFIGSVLFLTAGCLFHMHRQIMFVNYLPFLILAFLCVKKRKFRFLPLCMLLICLHSFYFAIAAFAAIGWYWLRTEKETFWKDSFFKKYIPSAVLSVCMAAALLLPTGLVLMEHRRSGGGFSLLKILELFGPNISMNGILFNEYGLGLTLICFYTILAGLNKKNPAKKEFFPDSVLFLSFGLFGIFSYILNGTLYARPKILAETSTKDISAAVHPALRTLLKISAHRNRPRFIVSALSVCRNASAWSALVQSSSVSVDFDRTWYSVFILPDTKTETKPYFANV